MYVSECVCVCGCVCERESESERPDLNWTAFSEPGNLILSGESCVLSRHVAHLWPTKFKSAQIHEISNIIQVCVCVFLCVCMCECVFMVMCECVCVGVCVRVCVVSVCVCVCEIGRASCRERVS